MSTYDTLPERLDATKDRLASANRLMQRIITEDYSMPSGRKVRHIAKRISLLSYGYAVLRAEQFNRAKAAA